MTTMKEPSRVNWQGESTLEHIKIGALQRIADATELMAKRYTELIAERDRFEASKNYWMARSDLLERRVAAQNGVITKLRKKLVAS